MKNNILVGFQLPHVRRLHGQRVVDLIASICLCSLGQTVGSLICSLFFLGRRGSTGRRILISHLGLVAVEFAIHVCIRHPGLICDMDMVVRILCSSGYRLDKGIRKFQRKPIIFDRRIHPIICRIGHPADNAIASHHLIVGNYRRAIHIHFSILIRRTGKTPVCQIIFQFYIRHNRWEIHIDIPRDLPGRAVIAFTGLARKEINILSRFGNLAFSLVRIILSIVGKGDICLVLQIDCADRIHHGIIHGCGIGGLIPATGVLDKILLAQSKPSLGIVLIISENIFNIRHIIP